MIVKGTVLIFHLRAVRSVFNLTRNGGILAANRLLVRLLRRELLDDVTVILDSEEDVLNYND